MFNFDLARYAFYIYSNKQYFVRGLKRLLRKRSNEMHIPFNIEKAFVIVEIIVLFFSVKLILYNPRL